MLLRMFHSKTKLLEPAWPHVSDGKRPRVVIEHPDESEAWALGEVLANAGFDVATCGGPSKSGGVTARCPLLSGGECALITGADAVVTSSSLTSSEAIVGAIRWRKPSLPLFLEAPRSAAGRYGDLGESGRLLPFPADLTEVITRLRRALAEQ